MSESDRGGPQWTDADEWDLRFGNVTHDFREIIEGLTTRQLDMLDQRLEWLEQDLRNERRRREREYRIAQPESPWRPSD
jgi:hypothetical protein